MTIKEAILKSLEEAKETLTHWEVLKNIQENDYCKLRSKTPESTISALLGDFIRQGDSRVKRVKTEQSTYKYYLSKNEEKLNFDMEEKIDKNEKIIKSYYERDLHKLFSTYLYSKDINNKTIYHEQSTKGSGHQKWIHPDMIGIKFLSFKTDNALKLLKNLNSSDMFRLNSYELKKEIRNDYELKESYFQAVSNSSWANYGYLVAFEINHNDNLMYEMERLNESFGIGIIELKSNPFESKILFPAKYRELDFKTIDKLCEINKNFSNYISLLEEVITAENKNINRIKKELQEFSDDILNDEQEIKKYCLEKNIPFEYNLNEQI